MPNKSDSAGKLHQYYTVQSLSKINNDCAFSSPLKSINVLKRHKSQFSSAEINSLGIIGDLTANCIMNKYKKRILFAEDIGVNSGAIGITNTDDLKITFDDNVIATFSLKCAKNLSQILSKNMGAKSLLRAYFNSPNEQGEFNNEFDKNYVTFLKHVLESNENDIRKLKKEINDDAKDKGYQKARFADKRYDHMNHFRDEFLNKISNELYSILKDLDRSFLAHACNLILDTEKHHYIGLYQAGKERVKYNYFSKVVANDIINIAPRGNDSVEIKTIDYSVGFRFKFESGITSSIKLVGDYKLK